MNDAMRVWFGQVRAFRSGDGAAKADERRTFVAQEIRFRFAALTQCHFAHLRFILVRSASRVAIAKFAGLAPARFSNSGAHSPHCSKSKTARVSRPIADLGNTRRHRAHTQIRRRPSRLRFGKNGLAIRSFSGVYPALRF